MAQSGYTPILIYASGTATNVPLAANMTSSASGAELALNYADGKLYYKNSSGVVTLLANTATVAPVTTFSAGTTGFTPSSATSGAVTLAGTLVVGNGGTGLTSLTAGYIPYGNGTSAFSNSSALTFVSNVLKVQATATGLGYQLVKNDSGTASQNGGAFDFLNYGPTGVGRAAGTTIGSLYFGASQPSSGALQDAAAIKVLAETQAGGQTPSSLNFYTAPTTTNTLRMTISSAGFTGINTGSTAPVSFLDVYGNSGVTNFQGTPRLGVTVQGSTSTNDYSGIDFSSGGNVPRARIASKFAGAGSYLQFGTSNTYASGITNTAMTIDYQSYIGMGGQQNPSTFLEVYNGSATTNPTLRISATDGSGSGAIGLGFFIANQNYDIARINGRYTSSGGGGYGDLDLCAKFNGTMYNVATISQWGLVGIGTQSPNTYAYGGTSAGQASLVTYSPTSRYGDVVLVKGNSGTANQNGHLINFQNYGPAGTGRAAGVYQGGLYFQTSQPTSGVLQDAAAIFCLAETQTGNNTASTLAFYTNSGNAGNALALSIDSGSRVTVGPTAMTSGTFNIYGSASGGDAATFYQNNAAGGYTPTTRYTVQIGGTNKYNQIYSLNVDAYGSGNCQYQIQDNTGTYQTVMQLYGGVSGGALNVGGTGDSHLLTVKVSTLSSNRTLLLTDGTRLCNIGTWDGSNMRFEANGGGMFFTNYNSAGISFGQSGSQQVFNNSSVLWGVNTSAVFQSQDYFCVNAGRTNLQASVANVLNAFAAGTGYGGAASIRAASERSAGTGMYFFQGVSSASSDGSSGTQNIIIYNNGNIQNTNNSYGTLSDVKLKKDIVPAGSQWDDVKAMARVMSKFVIINDVNQTRQLGWVAQDLQKVSPGLVYSTPDYEADANGNMIETGTETLGVHTSVANLKAFKALGEALERIEQLEARLAAANIH